MKIRTDAKKYINAINNRCSFTESSDLLKQNYRVHGVPKFDRAVNQARAIK